MKAATQINSADTVRCQELGEELVRLRKAANLSLRQVAHITCIDQSNITRFEKGHRPPNGKHLESLLTAYRADRPTRRRLETLAEQAGEVGWWQKNRTDVSERHHTLISLENKAQRIISFEPVVVPALLQTGDYSRAAMREYGMVPESQIEDGMAARLCRHSILEQWSPPTFVAVIDELVLYRVVGNRGVLRAQLDNLVTLSERPHITIRVLPNEGARSGAFGSFEFIKRLEQPPVVFVEQATSNLFVEQREEVETYHRIVTRLLDDALDERQSAERIATVATRLDMEERT